MESDPLSLERIAKAREDVAQNVGRVNGLTTVEVEDKMRACITILAALELAEKIMALPDTIFWPDEATHQWYSQHDSFDFLRDGQHVRVVPVADGEQIPMRNWPKWGGT